MRYMAGTVALAIAASGCSSLLGIEVHPTTSDSGTSSDSGQGSDGSMPAMPGMWTAPVEVTRDVYRGQLHADLDGGAFLVWSKVGPVGFAQRWTAVGGWSSAVQTDVAFTDLSGGTDGNAIAVGGTGTTVGRAMASFYSPGGGWSAAQQVDTEASPAYVHTVVAGIDSASSSLVIFSTSCTSCGMYTIKARLHTKSGGWGAIAPLTSTGGLVVGLRMAMAADGTAAIAYGQYESGFPVRRISG